MLEFTATTAYSADIIMLILYGNSSAVVCVDVFGGFFGSAVTFQLFIAVNRCAGCLCK